MGISGDGMGFALLLYQKTGRIDLCLFDIYLQHQNRCRTISGLRTSMDIVSPNTLLNNIVLKERANLNEIPAQMPSRPVAREKTVGKLVMLCHLKYIYTQLCVPHSTIDQNLYAFFDQPSFTSTRSAQQ